MRGDLKRFKESNDLLVEKDTKYLEQVKYLKQQVKDLNS